MSSWNGACQPFTSLSDNALYYRAYLAKLQLQQHIFLLRFFGLWGRLLINFSGPNVCTASRIMYIYFFNVVISKLRSNNEHKAGDDSQSRECQRQGRPCKALIK